MAPSDKLDRLERCPQSTSPTVSPSPTKTRISSTLSAVKPVCTALPKATLPVCNPELTTISATAAPRTGSSGHTPCRYAPKATAAAAMGAEKPTKSDNHPARNPNAGWKASRR